MYNQRFNLLEIINQYFKQMFVVLLVSLRNYSHKYKHQSLKIRIYKYHCIEPKMKLMKIN
jgi:hypothetical protein